MFVQFSSLCANHIQCDSTTLYSSVKVRVKIRTLYYTTHAQKYRVIRNDCRGVNNLPPRSPDKTPCDFFLWRYVKDQVYVPLLPASIPEMKVRIRTAIETITADMIQIFISVINQFEVHNFCFTIILFHASTCFEHMCSSSGGQNCITQPLVLSHL